MGSTVQQSQWVQQFNSHNEFNSSTVTMSSTVQQSQWIQQFNSRNGFNSSTVTMSSTVQQFKMGSTIPQSQWVQLSNSHNGFNSYFYNCNIGSKSSLLIDTEISYQIWFLICRILKLSIPEICIF